ncbi:uncharacterized protein LOC106013608, partial [Aplysia californica]|uniref:Uncharacterized protein LOC106013608 n=1 Tax=Aplysia californica TaxID=6500 RepID=A0ABM1W339_APLCA
MDKENFQRQWERFKPAVMRNRAVLISCLVVGLGLIGLAVTYSGGATDHPVTSHCETPQGPSPRNTDSCPWQLVLSDLSHRLRLLEMAFKEQVIAREVIAAEVSNQTDSSQELEKKLQEFSAAMSLVS